MLIMSIIIIIIIIHTHLKLGLRLVAGDVIRSDCVVGAILPFVLLVLALLRLSRLEQIRERHLHQRVIYIYM